MIKYSIPANWIKYDKMALVGPLTDAKAAILSLRTIPFQRNWVEELQYVQLKREVAGTSRIEGADFTERELEAALQESPEELFTRSQRQARAAKNTYEWIASLTDDRPIDSDLIREIHRRLVTGADDDHCPPGTLRGHGHNVTFGAPPHRGAEGGDECQEAFEALVRAIQIELRDHDVLIQALALHYHFAAIHPFLDGNGRTARALEALMLQRVGLRDSAFIAMSNYYYDEKNKYLSSLSATRADGHDLTTFLLFGLRGIAAQCQRLFEEINKHVSKALFRNLMYDLFNRLKTRRKRVIHDRQIRILKLLLELETIEWTELIKRTEAVYASLKNPGLALVRDVNELGHLEAIMVSKDSGGRITISINLRWPQEISETTFMEKMTNLPKGKTYPFL